MLLVERAVLQNVGAGLVWSATWTVDVFGWHEGTVVLANKAVTDAALGDEAVESAR